VVSGLHMALTNFKGSSIWKWHKSHYINCGHKPSKNCLTNCTQISSGNTRTAGLPPYKNLISALRYLVCSKSDLLRADCIWGVAKLPWNNFQYIFVGRENGIGIWPKSFHIFCTFMEFITNFWSWKVMITRSNRLLKCTQLVHWRKQNVPLC